METSRFMALFTPDKYSAETVSQPAKVLTGEETCAKRKSTSPCLLAIPAFDHIAGL